MNSNDRNGRTSVLENFSEGCAQQIKDIAVLRHLLKMLVSSLFINKFRSDLGGFQSANNASRWAALTVPILLTNIKISYCQNLENSTKIRKNELFEYFFRDGFHTS